MGNVIFCTIHVENIKHLFYECERLQEFSQLYLQCWSRSKNFHLSSEPPVYSEYLNIQKSKWFDLIDKFKIPFDIFQDDIFTIDNPAFAEHIPHIYISKRISVE